VKGRVGLSKPAEWEALASSLTESPDLVLEVGAAFGDPKALASLRARVTDRGAGAPARTAALDTLLSAHDPGLAPVLRPLLQEPALRGPALRALAAYDDPEAAAAILALYPSLGLSERIDALNTLAGRRASAKALMDALGKNLVPKQDFSAALIRQLSNHAELADQVALEWAVVRPTPEGRAAEIRRMRVEIQKGPPGDPSKGRAVFNRTCMQCHTLFGVGGKVGPEITGGNRSDLDYLLVNIMDPSAVVGRDYTATTIRTTGGRVLTGIIKQEDRNRLTLATENDTIVLPLSEIEARRPSEISMMPEGLLHNLSLEDRRDLIAYLRSSAQVPLPK
jgi:putative heme-binding domain-containing protein